MFVKDMVGTAYKRWKRGECIFIDADTGTGKTSFVLDQLVPEAMRRGGEVLFLSNRNLLRAQTKLTVARRQGIPTNPEWLGDIEEFEGITLLSYQKLQELVKMKKADRYLGDRYQFVIFDEAHYILEDSTFNAKIFYLLQFIKMTRGIKVFLSATMDEVKEFLIDGGYVGKLLYGTEIANKYLKQTLLDVFTNHIPNCSNCKLFVWEYMMPRTERRCEIRYFQAYEEVVEIMNKSRDKWLVFVSNKDAAKKWQGKLKIPHQILSASEKSPELLESIVEKEKFDTQVLITTKLLDNGVNFHDDELRHIVIDTISRTEFIQMLGRKRLHGDDDRLTLYIPQKSTSFFSGYLNLNVKKICAVLEDYENRVDIVTEMLEDASGAKFEIFRRFFIWSGSKFVLNTAGREKLTLQMRFLQRMKDEIAHDANAFIREQLFWIDRNDFSEKNFLSFDKQNDRVHDLERFLEERAEKWMSKVQQVEFRENLRNLMIAANVYEDKKCRLIGKKNVERFLREKFPQFYLQTNRSADTKETLWMIRRCEV